MPLRGYWQCSGLKSTKGFHVGQGISMMMNADLNSDGSIDIALADSASGSIRILFNDGNGNFHSNRNYLQIFHFTEIGKVRPPLLLLRYMVMNLI